VWRAIDADPGRTARGCAGGGGGVAGGASGVVSGGVAGGAGGVVSGGVAGTNAGGEVAATDATGAGGGSVFTGGGGGSVFVGGAGATLGPGVGFGDEAANESGCRPGAAEGGLGSGASVEPLCVGDAVAGTTGNNSAHAAAAVILRMPLVRAPNSRSAVSTMGLPRLFPPICGIRPGTLDGQAPLSTPPKG
jgi:hypothetical protein